MIKEDFVKILEKHILPLFTGSYISGEEISGPRDSEVAIQGKNSLLIKPSKNEEYRLILTRSRPFLPYEINLLKSIFAELNRVNGLNIEEENYLLLLQHNAIEKAIISTLTEGETASVLLGLINALNKWASRTYEGKKVALGLILNETEENKEMVKLHYSRLLSEEFFCLLSDGHESYIEFDKKGNLMGHVQIDKVRACPTIAPYEFESVARYCNDKRTGIVLIKDGDILVFKNHELLYAKRSGVWQIYSHDEVIELLSCNTNYSLKEIRRSIYYTALDCSFAHGGGCLVYVNKGMSEQALAHINVHDVLHEKYYEIKKRQALEQAGKLYNLQTLAATEIRYAREYTQFLYDEKCIKAIVLRQLIAGRKFQDLSRKLREEIVSMDGATVIDYDGTIITAGAILKIEAGSEGGGRLAAATTLAKYGIAIKISQDGALQGFNVEKNGRIKNIFNVG